WRVAAMDHALTRRGLLAGMGATAGIAAFSGAVGSAGAAVAGAPGLDAAALVPGLTYITVDGSAFGPRDSSARWDRTTSTQGTALVTGGTLIAPIVLPTGAVLKQVPLSYLFPPGSDLQASVQRKTFVGGYDAVAPPATLPSGPALQAFTWDLSETV